MRSGEILKVIVQVVGYSTLAVLGGGLLLTIAALTPRKWNFPSQQPCEVTIYISSDGFHTNLIVPVATTSFDWGQHLNLAAIANQPTPDYRYLQFGWGDRIFYMETPSWDQVSVSSALRALFFWQNQTAMFVKGHATVPRYAGEEIKCLRLSQVDYQALASFVNNSFQRTKRGEEQRLGSGQDQQSGFYAATGYYSIRYTCNSWTADALRAANVNTPVWGGLARPIMFHLRNGCECRLD